MLSKSNSHLVLAVCDEMPSVPSGIDVRDPIDMPREEPDWARIVLPERAPVPHLADAVVAARGEDVSVAVNEGDGVDVVVVGVDLKGK